MQADEEAFELRQYIFGIGLLNFTADESIKLVELSSMERDTESRSCPEEDWQKLIKQNGP